MTSSLKWRQMPEWKQISWRKDNQSITLSNRSPVGPNWESNRIVKFLLGDQVENTADSSPFCKIHLHKMSHPFKLLPDMFSDWIKVCSTNMIWIFSFLMFNWSQLISGNNKILVKMTSSVVQAAYFNSFAKTMLQPIMGTMLTLDKYWRLKISSSVFLFWVRISMGQKKSLGWTWSF